MDYRFAKMDEVVATAMTLTPGATDEHRVIFRQWCWEGVKQIGPTTHWLKTCNLKVKNLTFKKPSDLASTINVGLYNSSDQELSFEWNIGVGRVHTDRELLHSVTSQEEVTGRIDLSEDAYYFHLGSNGSEVDHMLLRYLAMPVDTNGEMLIPEDNMFAITMFIRWMWSMRKGDNQSEIELSRDTWFREKDRIYGNNKMPSVLRANEFALNKFMSLLNSFKPNRF